MAKFQKGNTGKPKGAKSKKTLVLDAFATHVVEGGMDKFMKELNTLKGASYVMAFMSIFEYVKPKLARVDGKIDGEVKHTVTFLDEH